MNSAPLPVELAWSGLAFGVYIFGVVVGLLRIDARAVSRLGLALLWPLGPLAFLVTTAILLLASLVAFPLIGAVVLALALAFAAFAAPADVQQPARATPDQRPTDRHLSPDRGRLHPRLP